MNSYYPRQLAPLGPTIFMAISLAMSRGSAVRAGSPARVMDQACALLDPLWPLCAAQTKVIGAGCMSAACVVTRAVDAQSSPRRIPLQWPLLAPSTPTVRCMLALATLPLRLQVGVEAWVVGSRQQQSSHSCGAKQIFNAVGSLVHCQAHWKRKPNESPQPRRPGSCPSRKSVTAFKDDRGGIWSTFHRYDI